MNTTVTRAVSAAVVAVLIATGLAGAQGADAAPPAGSSAAPLATGSKAAPTTTTAGARLWARHYDGPGHAADVATAVVVSRGGRTVFVTGSSEGASSGPDYATVAYSATTGTRLWAARYNGPADGSDAASAIAVSPSGRSVFVTGASAGAASSNDDATIAYSAITGARLWVARYLGAGGASSIAVSPDGSEVLVTGGEYATVAYSAATGTQLWAERWTGGLRMKGANAMAISPDGRTVFVTGYTWWSSYSPDTQPGCYFATIAYDAATGLQRWVHLTGGAGPAYYIARSLAVSPDGGKVFVTGQSSGGFATVAYSAPTGTRTWRKSYAYNGTQYGYGGGYSMAISPTGSTVYVTGRTGASATVPADYATIAYSAATGARLWVRRYDGPGASADYAAAIAVNAASGRVFVTGRSGGSYATIAYSPAGARLWAGRYNSPGRSGDYATAIAVDPVSGRVFVAGSSGGDYATVAYQG